MNTCPQVIDEFVPEHEFFLSSRLVDQFGQIVCKEGKIATKFCSNVMFLLVGFNKEQLNDTMLPVIVGHVPAGSAAKQLTHYVQIRNSDIFQQFDHGLVKNLLKYKSKSPPNYKLGNVKAKVALHYSKNDWLAKPKDVENLAKQLPNVVLANRLLDYLNFNHVDLIWGIDAQELLWNNMLKLMSQVEEEIGL